MSWNAVKWTFTATLAIVLLPVAVYAFPQAIGHERAYIVLSGSMVPTFDPGDIIYSQEVGLGTLEVGDIITFQGEPGSDRLYTHRIIDITTDGDALLFETKGDANEDPDPNLVHEDQVIAKYSFHAPWYGYLIAFVQTKLGFVLLMGLPGVAVIFSQMWVVANALFGDPPSRDKGAGPRAKGAPTDAAASAATRPPRARTSQVAR